MYYAILWEYGRATRTSGYRYGRYVRFATRAERDAFVEAQPYKTQPNAADPISSRDPELRRLMSRRDWGWATSWAVHREAEMLRYNPY